MPWLVIFFLIVVASSVSASDCFELASAKYSVPSSVLRAISRVESGGNPYAVNIGGKPHYPSNMSELAAVFSDIEQKSADIGLMQVNTWWFDKYNYPYTWGFNACWNIHFGAYILGYELVRSNGEIWTAVGRYHSPVEQRQQRYIEKVSRELE